MFETGVDEATKAFFLENGYLLFERLLPAAALQPLIEEFSSTIDARARKLFEAGILDDLYEDEGFETRLPRIYFSLPESERHSFLKSVHGKALKTAALFEIMRHPILLNVAESLVGPEVVFHPQFNTQVKLPGEEKMSVPWHQDMTFLGPECDATLMIDFWIPLVDVSMENGTLEVMPGSHVLGLLPHETPKQPTMFPRGIPDHLVPQIDAVPCLLHAGGAALFTQKTLHRSSPNRSQKARWTMDLRYQSADEPTGRPDIPALLLRSRKHPEKVVKSHIEWLQLWEGTGHEKY